MEKEQYLRDLSLLREENSFLREQVSSLNQENTKMKGELKLNNEDNFKNFKKQSLDQGFSRVNSQMDRSVKKNDIEDLRLQLQSERELRKDLEEAFTNLQANLKAELEHMKQDEFEELIVKNKFLKEALDKAQKETDGLRELNRALNQKLIQHGSALLVTQEAEQTLRAMVEDLQQRLKEETEAKLNMEQELEELSKSLFEEANKMVSTEARKKAQVEQELVETRTRLEMEDELINELKEKLVKLAENSRRKRKKISKKSRNAKAEKEKKSPKTPAEASPRGETEAKEVTKPMKDKRDIISGGFSSRSEIDLDSEISEFLTDMSDASETSSMRLGRTITQLELEEDVFDSETSKLYGFYFSFTTYKMEPDSILLKGFQEVMNDAENWESHWLCKQVIQVDIDPCLDFGRSKKIITFLSGKRSFLRFSSSSQSISISEFHTSMKNNTFVVEPIATDGSTPPTSPQTTLVKNKRGRLKLTGTGAGGLSSSTPSLSHNISTSGPNSSSVVALESCYLCSREAQCNYRFKLSDKAAWYKVCMYCRSRLVAVCEFFRFVRNLKAGMYQKSNLMDSFLDWTRLRIYLNAVQTMSV